MAESAQNRFTELTKVNGVVEESDLAAVFEQLGPVPSSSFLFGSWKGGSFENTHPAHHKLAALKWAGKDFRSEEDVTPMMVYDESGKRTMQNDYGYARLREIKFKGVLSVSMVYDNLPIIDHFRFVSDNTVMGAMDTKGNFGTYYFYLNRMDQKL